MTMPSCPPKRPRLHLSAHADVILRGRYLTKKVAGTIVETPAQLFWRVATDITPAEGWYDCMPASSFFPILPH
jgi:ribonucleoside-diphosphate reductase alpha chain